MEKEIFPNSCSRNSFRDHSNLCFISNISKETSCPLQRNKLPQFFYSWRFKQVSNYSLSEVIKDLQVLTYKCFCIKKGLSYDHSIYTSHENDVCLFVFQMSAEVSMGEPFKACSPLTNGEELKHRIAVLERGDCMFIDKACTWY